LHTIVDIFENKEVMKNSLKQSKQMNPLKKQSQTEEQKEEYEYIPRTDNKESDIFDIDNNRKFQDSQLRASSNNTRSTLPLNPFYGDFIGYIRLRKYDMIRQTLEE